MFQPPPPQPPTDFLNLSMSTITMMIAITFFMHAGAVFFNSRMVKEYKGIGLAVWAAGIMATQYFVIFFLPPGAILGTFGGVFTITGHLLIYLAICRFVDRPFNRFIVHGVAPLGYVGIFILALLPPEKMFIIPLTVSKFISVPLTFSSVYTLYRADTSRYRLGAYVTAVPIFLYGLVSAVRFVQALTDRQIVLPGPSWSNLFDVMSLYVLSYLWIAGFILKISQRLQSDLHDLAMNDALTRVRNRRAMQNMLDFEMRRVQTEVKDFSIILLDADHFKRVNDTYGHDTGDLVLRWLAQTLQSALRVQDIVARWGGEEFLILLPDTSLEEALEIAERLRAAVANTPIPDAPVPLKVTFSGGIANSKMNRDVNLLCKVADRALYVAKQTRNRIVSEQDISAS